jgi:DNA-binding NarL/FixJ family response regulator
VNIRLPVYVYAADPISQAGIAAQLRSRAEIHVVDDCQLDDAVVAVVVADEVNETTVRAIRALQRSGGPRVVLIATTMGDNDLITAAEAGICGFIRRSEAHPDALVSLVRAAAAGEASLPPDMLGRLLHQVAQLRSQVLSPRGLTVTGFTTRELDVLRLVADGLDTNEIAQELSYSERTIKNVIHDLTSRLQLRNRSHAVAYAVRQGLI